MTDRDNLHNRTVETNKNEYDNQLQVAGSRNMQLHQHSHIPIIPVKASDVDDSGYYSMPKRRKKTNYSAEQVEFLEQVFIISNYPCKKKLEAIALRLNLPEDRVRNWFQNRRARLKRTYKKQQQQLQESMLQTLKQQQSPGMTTASLSPTTLPLSSSTVKCDTHSSFYTTPINMQSNTDKATFLNSESQETFSNVFYHPRLSVASHAVRPNASATVSQSPGKRPVHQKAFVRPFNVASENFVYPFVSTNFVRNTSPVFQTPKNAEFQTKVKSEFAPSENYQRTWTPPIDSYQRTITPPTTLPGQSMNTFQYGFPLTGMLRPAGSSYQPTGIQNLRSPSVDLYQSILQYYAASGNNLSFMTPYTVPHNYQWYQSAQLQLNPTNPTANWSNVVNMNNNTLNVPWSSWLMAYQQQVLLQSSVTCQSEPIRSLNNTNYTFGSAANVPIIGHRNTSEPRLVGTVHVGGTENNKNSILKTGFQRQESRMPANDNWTVPTQRDLEMSQDAELLKSKFNIDKNMDKKDNQTALHNVKCQMNNTGVVKQLSFAEAIGSKPTMVASKLPTIAASNLPAIAASNLPTIAASNLPTLAASNQPTIAASNLPTIAASRLMQQPLYVEGQSRSSIEQNIKLGSKIDTGQTNHTHTDNSTLITHENDNRTCSVRFAREYSQEHSRESLKNDQLTQVSESGGNVYPWTKNDAVQVGKHSTEHSQYCFRPIEAPKSSSVQPLQRYNELDSNNNVVNSENSLDLSINSNKHLGTPESQDFHHEDNYWPSKSQYMELLMKHAQQVRQNEATETERSECSMGIDYSTRKMPTLTESSIGERTLPTKQLSEETTFHDQYNRTETSELSQLYYHKNKATLYPSDLQEPDVTKSYSDLPQDYSEKNALLSLYAQMGNRAAQMMDKTPDLDMLEVKSKENSIDYMNSGSSFLSHGNASEMWNQNGSFNDSVSDDESFYSTDVHSSSLSKDTEETDSAYSPQFNPVMMHMAGNRSPSSQNLGSYSPLYDSVSNPTDCKSMKREATHCQSMEKEATHCQSMERETIQCRYHQLPVSKMSHMVDQRLSAQELLGSYSTRYNSESFKAVGSHDSKLEDEDPYTYQFTPSENHIGMNESNSEQDEEEEDTLNESFHSDLDESFHSNLDLLSRQRPENVVLEEACQIHDYSAGNRYKRRFSDENSDEGTINSD
ncbi:unnamed protein product [Mytilus coruscus]|uniref:Homeobox domain-containing protein n=1 Tax=Mytilus coruscus TaxID=42192 RepID=A0A6J8DF14_MYTCO|nr:unnamed protein product [Mytilus coruscus]